MTATATACRSAFQRLNTFTPPQEPGDTSAHRHWHRPISSFCSKPSDAGLPAPQARATAAGGSTCSSGRCSGAMGRLRCAPWFRRPQRIRWYHVAAAVGIAAAVLASILAAALVTTGRSRGGGAASAAALADNRGPRGPGDGSDAAGTGEPTMADGEQQQGPQIEALATPPSTHPLAQQEQQGTQPQTTGTPALARPRRIPSGPFVFVNDDMQVQLGAAARARRMHLRRKSRVVGRTVPPTLCHRPPQLGTCTV